MKERSNHSLRIKHKDKEKPDSKDTGLPPKFKPIKELVDLAFKDLKKQNPCFPKFAIPKPKYTDKTSNGLTKCVIDWINLNGYQAERVNSTGSMLDNRKTSINVLGHAIIIGSTKWIKGTSRTGTADISAVIKGRSIKIEIKCFATGDHKQSLGQIAYQKDIEQAGGVYLIVRTFADFYNWFNETVNTEKT